MNENIYPTQLGVPIRACVELQFHMCILYFQAKETNSKQKEFEETAKKVRCAIEQLVALEWHLPVTAQRHRHVVSRAYPSALPVFLWGLLTVP